MTNTEPSITKEPTPLSSFNECLMAVLDNIILSQFTIKNLKLNVKPQNIVYDEWIAGIVVSSAGFRSIFKIHFNYLSLKTFIPTSDPVKINDFLKEICNLIAGGFKANLNKMNIDSGISLPFLTSGFDEFFFSESKNTGAWSGAWNICDSDQSFLIFSYEAEILNKSVLPLIAKLGEIAKDTINSYNSGELEFL